MKMKRHQVRLLQNLSENNTIQGRHLNWSLRNCWQQQQHLTVIDEEKPEPWHKQRQLRYLPHSKRNAFVLLFWLGCDNLCFGSACLLNPLNTRKAWSLHLTILYSGKSLCVTIRTSSETANLQILMDFDAPPCVIHCMFIQIIFW